MPETAPPAKATPITPGTADEPFSVCAGVPPLPKRMGGKAPNPLKAAAAALKPGQFIVVKKDKIKASAVAAIVNSLRGEGHKGLRQYQIANGDRVIVRDEVKA